MARPEKLISESALGRLMGHSPRALSLALKRAGVEPVTTEMRAGREYRTYNEREALAAVKTSSLATKQRANDRAARHRARVMDITLGVKDGKYIKRPVVLDALLERRAEILQAYRAVAGRTCNQLAAFNANNPTSALPEGDGWSAANENLITRRRELFDEALEYILITLKKRFPWQK